MHDGYLSPYHFLLHLMVELKIEESKHNHPIIHGKASKLQLMATYWILLYLITYVMAWKLAGFNSKQRLEYILKI